LKRSGVATLMALVFSCVVSTVALGQTPLLRQLAKEDQDSRMGKTIARTDDERVKIVLEFLAKGTLKGPEDQFDAALVLQHTTMLTCGERLVSRSVDNYMIAHYLFISAYEGGYKDALFLIAASLDRYLWLSEGYQKYGTQRAFNQTTGKEELVPIDRKTTDSERAKYGVAPLANLLKAPEKKAP
jgi:hypothetical protein